jgi:hypothetical protein
MKILNFVLIAFVTLMMNSCNKDNDYLSGNESNQNLKSTSSGTITWTGYTANTTITSYAKLSSIVFNGYVYIFYKGTGNDSIYYYINNKAYSVPEALTSTTPNVCAFNGKLYLAYKGHGSHRVWYIYASQNSNGTLTWSSEAALSVPATTGSPSITVLDDYLYFFYKGENTNKIWYTTLSTSNVEGTEYAMPTAETSYYPVVTTFNGSIYVVYKGKSSSSSLFCMSFDGSGWSSETNFNYSSVSKYSVSVISSYVQVVMLEGSDIVTARTQNGTSWTESSRYAAVPYGTTSYGPCALYLNGSTVYTAYSALNGSTMETIILYGN